MDKLMSQAQWNRVQFRAQVLDVLEAGTITQKEAANRLQISDRQVRRLVVAYRGNNMGGLVSKKLGAQSNRRIPASIIADAVELIGTKYRDFGPIFASEKSAESHQIHLSTETTHQAMIRAVFWQAKRGFIARAHPCANDVHGLANSSKLTVVRMTGLKAVAQLTRSSFLSTTPQAALPPCALRQPRPR